MTSRNEILLRLKMAYALYAEGRPTPLANAVALARKRGIPESTIQEIKAEAFRHAATRSRKTTARRSRDASRKPLEVRKVGTKWYVYLHPAAVLFRAKMSAERRTKIEAMSAAAASVPLVKTPTGKLDFIVGGKPKSFTKEEAKSMAFSYGKYALNLGDFAYGWIEGWE